MPSWYATHVQSTECNCYTCISIDCTDGEVHLVGGSNETEGTVEVCHNKIWGMVSGLGWKERDARVTCRQLQFSEEGICIVHNNVLFHHYALLQVSILTLILPLASLDELFISVLFDV